jgi:hypothetical protein
VVTKFCCQLDVSSAGLLLTGLPEQGYCGNQTIEEEHQGPSIFN